MLDFKIDEQFLQTHTLEFKLPLGDPKTYWLAEDIMLEYEGRFYYIAELYDTRRDNELFVQVKANALWYRLGERKAIGSFAIQGKTPSQGLALILAAAQSAGLDWWPSSYVSDSLTNYSLEATDSSYLDLIYQWAKICQCEVAFDTASRKVSMATTIGGNYGLSFRYDRNLTQIERVVIPPKVTRLYPYGRNGLSISGVNPSGEDYLEDYSFYTGQGLSLPEAIASYRKDDSFQDNSFIDENALYDAAVARLAVLAQPIISYSVGVVDLSALTGLDESNIGMGDYCVVEDDPLGISVITRVVRFVRYPYEPQKNQIELSYLPVQLPDPNISSSRAQSQEWELFESLNRTGARYFWGLATGILHHLPLMVTGTAEWVIGFKMRAVGHGNSNVTLSVIDLYDNSEVWPAETFAVTDGEVIHRDFTLGDKELAQGAHGLQVRVVSDTSGSGITVEQGESAFWVLARAVVEQSLTYANSITWDTRGVFYWSPPPGVVHLKVEMAGAMGEQGYYAGLGEMERPGYGCYIEGELDVAPEQQLEIHVDQNGGAGDHSYGLHTGGGGGGYAGVFYAGTAFEEAIAVAGGGGGSGVSDAGIDLWVRGGDAGFYQGGNGSAWAEGNGGTGASQTAGGEPQQLDSPPTDVAYNTGGMGYGGNAGDELTDAGAFTNPGGGGGAGWFGGGANQEVNYGGGGGGGSSWAPGLRNLLFEDGAYSEPTGYVTISWADPE